MNRKAFVLEDITGINAKQTNRGVYTYTYMHNTLNVDQASK